MRVSLNLAIGIAFLGVKLAEAISFEALNNWASDFDLLDLDYEKAFADRSKLIVLNLEAPKSAGGTITLNLKSNDKLFVGGRPDDLGDDFFNGTVSGQENESQSGASITFWKAGLTGRITYVSSNKQVQTIYVDHLDETNQTVLYNEADIKDKTIATGFRNDQVFINSDGTYRTENEDEPASPALQKREQLTFQQGPPQTFFINRNTNGAGKDCQAALVADSSFSAEFENNTVKQMSSVWSDAARDYERGFNIGLPIVAAFVDRNGALGLGNNGVGQKGDISSVLKKLSDSVKSKQINIDNMNICVIHMFTSRSFGATLGVAFVGSPDPNVDGGICSDASSVGVSTHIASSGKPLPIAAWSTTVAHEIGHSFGSQHDEQIGCAGSGAIMAAAVRTTGPAVNSFSSCSVNKITAVINAKGTCFVDRKAVLTTTTTSNGADNNNNNNNNSNDDNDSRN